MSNPKGLRVSPEGEAEKDLTSMLVGLFLAVDLLLGLPLSRNRIAFNEVADCLDPVAIETT